MKPNAIAAGAAGLLILITGCGSSSEPAASQSGGIVISGSAYSGTLTVKPGQQVTVTNQDPAPHTLTDLQTNLFSTGTIEPGASGTVTAPAQPGAYPFTCRIHLAMKGTLTVAG